MPFATRTNAWASAAIAALATIAISTPSHAAVKILPKADRQILEQYLGAGVVGDAVDARPIADPSNYYPFRKATLLYQVTSGENKGKNETHVWTALQGNPPGSRWQVAWEGNSALSLNRANDGSIFMLTHDEGDEGMRNKYSPPEPMVLKGMNPGDTRKSTSDVEVFDLANPDKLKHKGSLDLTLTYLGAYEVTVPAGSFDAILLKWEYSGKVGPAKVSDVQYRLLAPGVGTVAEIEKKKVSAMMVYNDEAKIGKVLVAAPAASKAPAVAAPKVAPPVAADPINDRDRDARAVITKFKNKDPGLERFFKNAAGWAVFPSVAKGAFIVGGARGDGVVYQNDQVIGYSTLTQGSIGLQVGGQAYSEIIFFEHQAALNHFKSGNAEFSAQVSAVAVTAGASADADYAEGVAVFTQAKGGAMLEASIGGQGFSFEPK